MVHSINSGPISQPTPAKRAPQLDALTEKRVEQNRQLAIAATRDDHHRKVQAAVASFVNYRADADKTPSTSLANAQNAYSEF